MPIIDDLKRGMALSKSAGDFLVLDNDLHKAKLTPVEQDKIRKRKATVTRRLCETLGTLTMVAPDLPNKDFNEWLQKGLTLQMLEKHLSGAKPWLDILIDQGRSLPPVELNETLNSIAGHLSTLSGTLQSRYISLVEKKLNIPRRDLKGLMKHHEENTGNSYSEIRERQLHFMGEPLGNFSARISHELMVDDGLNPPTVRYSIEGGLASGQALQPLQVEARVFSILDWIPDNSRIYVGSFLKWCRIGTNGWKVGLYEQTGNNNNSLPV